jgi:putative endonuclease
MAENSQWWVYWVHCADDSFYTGITTDLERRVNQHNGKVAGGARYTSARRPVTLVYSEKSEDRSSASKREYVLRKITNSKKKEMVKSQVLGMEGTVKDELEA